jgi:hypothetical protein
MRRARATVKQLDEAIELFPPTEISRIIGVETKLGIGDASRRPWITAGYAWNNLSSYILDGWHITYGLSRALMERPMGLDQLDMIRWLVRLHEMFRHAYLNPDRPLPQVSELHRIIRPNVPSGINVQAILNAFTHVNLPLVNHLSPTWIDDGRPCVPLAMGIALAFVQDNPRVNILPDMDTRYMILRMAGWNLENTMNPADVGRHDEYDEIDEDLRQANEPF